jgi:HrpA-like RNA helicase
VLASATYDVEKYATYFNVPMENVFDVLGSVFTIHKRFLPSDTPDFYNVIVKIVDDIHSERIDKNPQGKGDILIFLPGMGEINMLKSLLSSLSPKYIQQKNPFIILPIDGQAVKNDSINKKLIFMDYSKLQIDNKGEYDYRGNNTATRRIIISTSVAETGITIDTLGHVIDAGLSRVMETYAPFNISGLITKPATKNRVKQRMGRAGRKFDGYFYATYTEETFESMHETQLPEIIVQDINKQLLYMLEDQADCFDVNKIDMLDVPPIDTVKQAIELNIVLGNISIDNGDCYELTSFGLMAKTLRYLTMESFRMIMSGYVYDVSISDLITIAALCAMRSRDLIKPGKTDVAVILKESLPGFFFAKDDHKFYEKFQVMTLDTFIEQLFIFESFALKAKNMTPNELLKWCISNGIKMNGMMMLATKRLEIMDDLINNKFNPLYLEECRLATSSAANYLNRVSLIKLCMYDGFILNLLTLDTDTRQYKTRFNMSVKVTGMPRNMQRMPTYILTNKIDMADDYGSDTYRYKLSNSNISVMDGYVAIDDNYLLPRS